MKEGYWYKTIIWLLVIFIAAAQVRVKLTHNEFRETLDRIENAVCVQPEREHFDGGEGS